MKARTFAKAAGASAALALALAALVGCAGGSHQVIGANESCASCHSEERETFDWGVAVPAGTVESGPSVTVKARGDASSVSVCVPAFTAEDGSAFVPVEAAKVAVSGGEAVVELEDGLWALCIDEGDSARSRLVHVASTSGEAAVVEL